MQKIFFFLFVFFCLISKTLLAQQDSKSQNLSSFESIEISGPFDVFISSDGTEKISISGEKKILSEVKIEVKNNTLFVSLDLKHWHGKGEAEEMQVNLSFKKLKSIKTNSSADVVGKTAFSVNDLELSAFWGSSIRIETEGKSVDCSINSGSGIYLKGKTQNLKGQINEGSLLEANFFTSEKSSIRCYSGSLAKIISKKELDAEAGTGALIVYEGSPNLLKVNTVWGGEIRKK